MTWLIAAILLVVGQTTGNWRRTARGLALVLLLAPLPSNAQEQKSDITFRLMREPLRCTQTSENRQLCDWHGAGEHVVCEFDDDETRTSRPCWRFAENTKMSVFPGSNLRKRNQPKHAVRRRLMEQARAKLNGAGTVEGVVGLVGTAPFWCASSGSRMRCAWTAVRRTPGYILLAQAANKPGKKLDLICEFGGEAPGCTVSVMGTAPEANPK